MSSNYPCGTGDNDPNAPWNEKQYEVFNVTIENGCCVVCDEFDIELNEDHWCKGCFEANQEIEEEEPHE